MINKEVTEVARQKLGDFLRSERERKGISKYRVIQNSGMSMDQVNAIEKGSKAYTIDALLETQQPFLIDHRITLCLFHPPLPFGRGAT